MKIISWNVAGLRAFLKKCDNVNTYQFLQDNNPDIICLQETKCSPDQVSLPECISSNYKYRFWGINPGTTQRKGLSGVCIWSKINGTQLKTPEFDTEGRLCIIEYDGFILVNVYTPNSQGFQCPRFYFRVLHWDIYFLEYVSKLNKYKPTIICGDLNVVSSNIDYFNYKSKVNTMPALFYEENNNFKNILKSGYIDSFRHFHPSDIKFTHWSHLCKSRPKNGWRLDYFLTPNSIIDIVEDSLIFDHQLGSDHCPIMLILNT